MSRQGVKIQLEAIRGKDGQATGSHHFNQGVHHAHGHIEGARTKLDHRDQFAFCFCRQNPK